MIKYEVVPHVGVGPVRLGMSRGEVRRVLQGSYCTFLKGPTATSDTDAFHDAAFQVFYDENEAADYIELAHDPAFSAVYRGLDVFETDANDLVSFILRYARFDRDDPEFGFSYIFPELDLSIWRPTVPESGADVEGRRFSTIGVGAAGYYGRGSDAACGKAVGGP